MDHSSQKGNSRPAASSSLSSAPAGTSANSACAADAATNPQATDQEHLSIPPTYTSPSATGSQCTGSAQSPTASAVAVAATADAAADGVEAQSPGRRRRLGPDSTWAIRQSAELEGLQAALGKQCVRRGRQPVEQPAPADADRCQEQADADNALASADTNAAIPAENPDDEPRYLRCWSLPWYQASA